jgi:hypothetical protein
MLHGISKTLQTNIDHIMKIKRFYCSFEDCNKSFRSEDQLAYHSQVHTQNELETEDRLLFECDICKMKFSTKRSVSAHKRVHQYTKVLYTKKIINYLTSRLADTDFFTYEIPKSPYSLETVSLPQVTGPAMVELPEFLMTFNDRST